MQKPKLLGRLLLIAGALVFNIHFDYDTDNGLSLGTVGIDAYALLDADTTYSTGSCKDQNGTWQATCKTPDPKGPCDKKVDPSCM